MYSLNTKLAYMKGGSNIDLNASTCEPDGSTVNSALLIYIIFIKRRGVLNEN